MPLRDTVLMMEVSWSSQLEERAVSDLAHCTRSSMRSASRESSSTLRLWRPSSSPEYSRRGSRYTPSAQATTK